MIDNIALEKRGTDLRKKLAAARNLYLDLTKKHAFNSPRALEASRKIYILEARLDKLRQYELPLHS